MSYLSNRAHKICYWAVHCYWQYFSFQQTIPYQDVLSGFKVCQDIYFSQVCETWLLSYHLADHDREPLVAYSQFPQGGGDHLLHQAIEDMLGRLIIRWRSNLFSSFFLWYKYILRNYCHLITWVALSERSLEGVISNITSCSCSKPCEVLTRSSVPYCVYGSQTSESKVWAYHLHFTFSLLGI